MMMLTAGLLRLIVKSAGISQAIVQHAKSNCWVIQYIPVQLLALLP